MKIEIKDNLMDSNPKEDLIQNLATVKSVKGNVHFYY